MNIAINKFASGWISVAVELSDDDIDKVIDRLVDLKENRLGHFHWRTDDFSQESGVADVHFSKAGNETKDNMTIE